MAVDTRRRDISTPDARGLSAHATAVFCRKSMHAGRTEGKPLETCDLGCDTRRRRERFAAARARGRVRPVSLSSIWPSPGRPRLTLEAAEHTRTEEATRQRWSDATIPPGCG
jgi:hypothetical protein